MNTNPAYKKSTFGPAFCFIPRRQRRALANYYAFCRLADDIADEPSEHPQQDLQELVQEIRFVFIGAPRTEWGKQLLEDMRRFHIPQECFSLLLEGMQADLQKKNYQPEDASRPFEKLDWYIYRVAVVVGKATLAILGLTGPQADELAQTLGTAVQLTNIVRDVYEDAQMGRVYVPCNLPAQTILQLQQQNLQDTAQGKLFTEALEKCILRAEENYRRAFILLDEFWPVTVLPCRIMGYVYQKNLAKIKRTNLAFKKAVKLNKFEKIQAVLHALLKTLF